ICSRRLCRVLMCQGRVWRSGRILGLGDSDGWEHKNMRLVINGSENADWRRREQFRQATLAQRIGRGSMPITQRHRVGAGYEMALVNGLERVEVSHALRGCGVCQLNGVDARRQNFGSQFSASL